MALDADAALPQKREVSFLLIQADTAPRCGLIPALGGIKPWSLFVCGKRRMLCFVEPLFASFAGALACSSVCAASLSRALYTQASSHPETPQQRAACRPSLLRSAAFQVAGNSQCFRTSCLLTIP
jgi:hypothetical protein